MKSYPPLEITTYWASLNDSLIDLVDAIPEDRMDWSPSPDLWNFRGILLHIMGARHRWMDKAVQDGEPTPDYFPEGQSRDGLKNHLRLSWERLERFLASTQALAKNYPSADDDGAWRGGAHSPQLAGDGHWIAFHRLQHDAIHRADILNYLGFLGIEPPPDTGSPT